MRRTSTTALLAAMALVGGQAPASGQQLFLHGYATQGYGSTSEYAQLGMTTKGTGDLRAAALQARLAFFSTGTQVVVQGAHRRVGNSPIASIVDDVELDWAFVEQRVGGFSARVGRIPIPRGLLNEVRDVGTLLPFYSASRSFYTDGVETVDGVSVRYSQGLGGFDLEAQGFAGTVPVVVSISDAEGPNVIDVDGENTWGGQLTLGLPLPGARILAGMLDADVPTDTPIGPQVYDWEFKWVGAEYRGDRFFARAERFWTEVTGFQKGGAWYVQGGVNVWDQWWINGQREYGWTRLEIYPFSGFEYDNTKDWAAGVSWAYSPQLVLKAEYHWYEGFLMDQFVNIGGPAPHNRYFMLSVATAF